MDAAIAKIPTLYFVVYLAVGWVGIAITLLAMTCREHGYVSWGALIGQGLLLPPVFTLAAPMLLCLAAILLGVWLFEKGFGWLAPPMLRLLAPIGKLLAALAIMVGRKLDGKAFACPPPTDSREG